VAGKPVVDGHANEGPTSRTSGEESPQRFRPVNAAPLKGLIPIPRSVLRVKGGTTTDCRKCGTPRIASTNSPT
jgi:hypothetical protein